MRGVSVYDFGRSAGTLDKELTVAGCLTDVGAEATGNSGTSTTLEE